MGLNVNASNISPSNSIFARGVRPALDLRVAYLELNEPLYGLPSSGERAFATLLKVCSTKNSPTSFLILSLTFLDADTSSNKSKSAFNDLPVNSAFLTFKLIKHFLVSCIHSAR